MTNKPWPFKDPMNVVTFTVADIAFGRTPILHVCHDAEDGGWQFLTGGPLPNKEEWMLVALSNITTIDPTVLELATLPLGWQATRSSLDHPWLKQPQ